MYTCSWNCALVFVLGWKEKRKCINRNGQVKAFLLADPSVLTISFYCWGVYTMGFDLVLKGWALCSWIQNAFIIILIFTVRLLEPDYSWDHLLSIIIFIIQLFLSLLYWPPCNLLSVAWTLCPYSQSSLPFEPTLKLYMPVALLVMLQTPIHCICCLFYPSSHYWSLATCQPPYCAVTLCNFYLCRIFNIANKSYNNKTQLRCQTMVQIKNTPNKNRDEHEAKR